MAESMAEAGRVGKEKPLGKHSASLEEHCTKIFGVGVCSDIQDIPPNVYTL